MTKRTYLRISANGICSRAHRPRLDTTTRAGIDHRRPFVVYLGIGKVHGCTSSSNMPRRLTPRAGLPNATVRVGRRGVWRRCAFAFGLMPMREPLFRSGSIRAVLFLADQKSLHDYSCSSTTLSSEMAHLQPITTLSMHSGSTGGIRAFHPH